MSIQIYPTNSSRNLVTRFPKSTTFAIDKPICSDCAIIGTSHKNHEFEKLVNIYSKHLDKINTEKNVLDDKLGDLNSKAHSIERYAQMILRAQEQIQNDLNSNRDHDREEILQKVDRYVEDVYKVSKLVELSNWPCLDIWQKDEE